MADRMQGQHEAMGLAGFTARRQPGIQMRIAIFLLAIAVAGFTGCDRPSAASPIEARTAVAEPATNEPESTPTETAKPAEHEDATQAKPASVAAEPAPAPVAQRPPADRTVTRPGDAEKVTFEDLNLGMQADVVFRPFMITDRVKDLEGKRISIVGYMHPPESQRGIKKFILLKNTQCKFGPGGQADHLTDVVLKANSSTSYSPSPLKIEGTLVLEPFEGPDGNTWSIYRLESAQIR